MSDELDWNFVDKDDAKAEIRAAVAAPAVISCRRSLRSCARSRAGYRPSRAILWTMACPAASWRLQK